MERAERRTSSTFTTPEDADSEALDYDLYNIEESGELIAITISGPDTYFEFRGKGFGLQNDLAESYAQSIGVRLRMEVAHDTAEIRQRLENREVDVATMDLPPTPNTIRCKNHWLVNKEAVELAHSIDEWYSPDLLQQTIRVSKSNNITRRTERPIMLDASTGRISQYDTLFQRYAAIVGWDWRLLVAQCYQESAFDPQAISWAGAQGLMQIMPSTAAHLGINASDVFEPEKNIEAGVRYLKELNQAFSDIRPQSARIPYVLAAYNGGVNHIRDAMALTRKYGKSDKAWREVEPYVLLLSQPQYYNDPVVTSGYLRGKETHSYVRAIMDRWMKYRGIARGFSNASTPTPSKNPKNKIDIKHPDSI